MKAWRADNPSIEIAFNTDEPAEEVASLFAERDHGNVALYMRKEGSVVCVLCDDGTIERFSVRAEASIDFCAMPLIGPAEPGKP